MEMRKKAFVAFLVFFVFLSFFVTMPSVKAVTTQTDWVTALGSQYTTTFWGLFGTSPYLNFHSQGADYIYVHDTLFSSGAKRGDFTFTTTSLSSITACTLIVESEISGGMNGWVDVYNDTVGSPLNLGDASDGQQTPNQWLNTTIDLYSQGFTTVAKINAISIYFYFHYYLPATGKYFYIDRACLSVTGSSGGVSYKLNLQIKDYDLDNTITGATITMNNGSDQLKNSNSNGWCNYTGISASSVTVKVKYFGFWVNGTFTISISADTTVTVKCKIYDVYVRAIPNNQVGWLGGANITVSNGTHAKIVSVLSASPPSNFTGYAKLTLLPNATNLIFTVRDQYISPHIIANVTRDCSISDDNILSAIQCDQNYSNMTIPWAIIFTPSLVLTRKKYKDWLKNKLLRKTTSKFMALRVLSLIGIVFASTLIYYDWTATLTGTKSQAVFYYWADGHNSTQVSFTYNIYSSVWTIDYNASWGIKNSAGSSRTILLWVNSCNASSWFANYTVQILISGSSVAKWTTSNFASVGSGTAVSWSQSTGQTSTIRCYMETSTSMTIGHTANIVMDIKTVQT